MGLLCRLGLHWKKDDGPLVQVCRWCGKEWTFTFYGWKPWEPTTPPDQPKP